MRDALQNTHEQEVDVGHFSKLKPEVEWQEIPPCVFAGFDSVVLEMLSTVLVDLVQAAV